MPTYEYQCFSCGHQFEAVQRISDEPISLCPKCNKQEAKRLLSASAFHLKGTGWYKTDYANGKSASNGSSSKSTAPESKSTASEAPSCDAGGCGGGGCGSTSSDD